jgi:hypothetical protein
MGAQVGDRELFKDIKLLAKAQMLKPEKQKQEQEHSRAPLDFHAWRSGDLLEVRLCVRAYCIKNMR